MLGIDKTTISRFRDASETLVKRILHPDEVIEYQTSEDKQYYLAARWAIKEALFKADNENKNFNEIRINKSYREYTYPGYVISTTSEGDSYIAIVMKER